MSSFTPLTFSANGPDPAGKRPKNTRRRLGIMAFLFGMLLMFNTASSQIIAESGIINEICPSCTSGDVRIEKVLLVDAAGVPVTASCTPGALLSDLYLQFNLNVISQERYGFLITGDLYVNNQFVKKIYQCYAQTFSQGRTSVKINESLTFNCGQPIEIRNAFTAWSQSAPTVPGVYEVCNRYNPATNAYDCAALSPKCYQYPYNIRVVGPLVSDFGYTTDCVGNTGVKTVQFSDLTTGGELPYTYAWDFGDGTTSTVASPLKTYAAAGTYTVTLRVTDGIGQVNTRSHNVLVGSCCDFIVTAPGNTSLGNYTCTNFNTIPAIPNTIEQLKSAPYNISMGAFPCGTLRFTVSDNQNAVQCSASVQNITRTIVVYDDKNNDGDKDADEPSQTINYTYSISSSIPAAPTATGASRCGAGSVTLTASGSGTLRWYDKDGNLVGTGSSFATPSLTENTTYFVSSMDCCESPKTPVVATVNPAPVASISGNSSICAGETATLTASGGSSYLWSNGATTSSITVSPTETTIYSVEVSSDQGCKDSKSMTVTVNPLPVINIEGNTTICFGGSTTLTASGGASYKWSNGATTASIEVSPAATTTYSVEVTSAAGCKSSKSVTVLVNDKPVVDINGKKEICAGEETVLTASGGVTFAWSTGETTSSITVKPGSTTTYNVVVTSGANCQATKSVEVVVNPLPVVVLTPNSAICKGDRITLTASGGATYKWSNGATTSSIVVSPEVTTTYSVEVTSSKGCTSVASTTVTVNPLPVINIEGNTTICFGGSTTLTASGGVSYKWSNGATTASIEVSPAATSTYSVEVTSAAGCKSSKSVTVLVNDKPVVDINGKKEICAGEETTLTASGGATFAWSTGETTSSITVKPGATTTYNVVVTSGANCQATKSVEVVVNPLPVVVLTANSAICKGDKITLSASGGVSYKWSNGAITSSIEVSPEETTTYSVEVASSKGCTSVASTTVTVNPLPVINIEGNTTICFGGSTTLTASGGASYKWSNGATTASIEVSPAATSTYSVEATSAAGCKSSKSVTVLVNDKPIVDINGKKEICAGEETTLTASGGATFAWSTGETTSSITVKPGSTTTYNVVVTSGSNCQATKSVEVVVNPLPVVVLTANSAICKGDRITLTASGGVSYKWSNGATTSSIVVSPEETTTYSVEVSSEKGCSSAASTTVTVNPLPVVNIEGNTTICFGRSTTLTASGGASYKWSNGATTASIEVSPASTTTYSVEVTTDKGCVASGSVTVTVNPLPVVNIEGNTTICFGGSTTLTASGGASYKWSNGSTSASIEVSPQATTEYSVEVTTDKGCVAGKTVEVIVNPLPEIVIDGNTVICYGGSTTLTASGGASYLWNTGATTASITVEPAATTEYSVTVTTDKGCVDSRTITVIVNDKPIINISGTTEICFGQETTLTASGGANFKWSTGETTASIKVKPNANTVYNVEVTSGENCRDDKNVAVIVNALPEARMTESREICLGDKIVLNASGGASYKWLNLDRSEASVEVSPKETTEYTVEVSSEKGCVSTRKMKLTVNALPEARIGGDRNVCFGLSTTLTASGGTKYNWSTGSDANSIVVSPRANTTYTVEVTSEQGCMVKEEVAISVSNCGNFCTYTQYSFGTHYENEKYIKDANCVTDKSEATIEYAISKWPNSNIRIGEGRVNIKAGDAKWVIAFLPHAGYSTPMNSYPTMERLANDASVKNNLLAQTIVLAINMGINESFRYFSLKGGYLRTEGLVDCGVNGNKDGRISNFYIDKKGLADVDGEPGITVNDVYMIANMYLAGKTYENFNIHTVADIVETLNKSFEGCRSFKDFTDKAPEIGGKANYVKVYPNPFVSYINFEFVAPESGSAEVEILDMQGRLMSRTTLGNVAAQEKTTYRLNTNNLSYGQYIYRLKVGNWIEQGKVIRFR